MDLDAHVGGRPLRALITGASGLLGRAVLSAFRAAGWEIRGSAFRRAGTDLDSVDLRNPEAAGAWVRAHRPEVLVHAAAERHPDLCEGDPEGTWALNVEAPRVLAQACREVGAWMVYVSTDYVFDGTAPPYHPEDTPNPLNAYGRSKLAGEGAVLGVDPRFAVLRVPILYGPTSDLGESAVTEPLLRLRAGGVQALDAWALRHPTFTPDVAAWLLRLAELRPGGLFHGSGREPMTKADMARRLATWVGLDPRAIQDALAPTPGAPRPRDCRLDCGRLEALGVPEPTPFARGLAELQSCFTTSPLISPSSKRR